MAARSRKRIPARQSKDDQWARKKWAWIFGAFLVLAVAIAYQQVWHAGYIWDDDSYVTKNATLRDLHGLWRIWFEVAATPQYYPLVHTSFWIEHHLWGLNPLGYHLVNLVLHGLAAILLWRVLVRLGIPGAWLAAAIFALHPVEVESVAWITERKNVLSAVFYFAAAMTYLRFESGRDSEKQGGQRWYLYVASLFLFVLALLSKTVACSLPAALLLVRWWKSGRIKSRDVLPLLPFFAFGLGLGLLTAWLEKHHVRAEGDEWALTFGQRSLIAGRALWFYASKILWPANLTFIYPRWDVSAAFGWAWLFPSAFAAVVGTLWQMRARIGRGPLVAVLFFAGTLFPALGFINVFPFRYSFVADHFQYLAGVGLIILAAAGLVRLPRFISPIVLAVLAVLTWKQVSIYRGLETLWTDTVEKNPESWMVQNSYAAVLMEKGQIDDALLHFQKALELNPESIVAHSDLGYLLLQKGRVDESFAQLQKALEIEPNYAAAHFNLANTLLQLGRIDEAVFHLEKALALNPSDAEAQKNLAWVLATCPDARVRDGTKAVELAESADLAESRDPTIVTTLAAAYAETGRFADAIRTAERALQLATDSGNVALANGIRAHINLYRSEQPVRDIR
jgi:protein O-mannosyl-transferase